MDAIDDLLWNARLYYLGSASRVHEPARRLAILTCIDARLDIHRLLGLQPGDAHVISLPGARATPEAIAALALSQGLLGTREVMIVSHTDCALSRFTDAEMSSRVAAASHHPFSASWGSFTDPKAALAEDIRRLRACPYLAHRDKIRGFLFDLAASKLAEVVVPA